jgi:hypothetical protein
MTTDVERSLQSALPAMREAQDKLSEMVVSRRPGWVRVMFHVQGGKILRTQVETQEVYPGIQNTVDTEPGRD